ncbi:MAG: hypothetical protein JWO10_1028 [Microbacteriaceae bacterium]|nr:hypothetical protein [Microbacteriaceae bacterium]
MFTIPDPVQDAIAVLFPVRCAGCGRQDRALCAECLAGLRATPSLAELPDGTPVVSALRYEAVARRAILEFKEQGRTDIARALADAFAVSIAAALHGQVELAALPVGRAAFRRRGYDPVRLLLARAHLGRPSAVLQDAHQRAVQKGLDSGARRLNLAGSLHAVGDVRGRRFLIVDDVVTTGATITEAAGVLRRAGAEVVGAATLAFTPKHFGASGVMLGQTRDIPSQRVYGKQKRRG